MTTQVTEALQGGYGSSEFSPLREEVWGVEERVTQSPVFNRIFPAAPLWNTREVRKTDTVDSVGSKPACKRLWLLGLSQQPWQWGKSVLEEECR